mgnify:FL=1|jgi:hypothetical protein
MENVSQQNREEIIKLQGKIDLVNQEVKQIRTNHLVHLESQINDIKKILWFITAVVVSNVAVVLRQLLSG